MKADHTIRQASRTLIGILLITLAGTLSCAHRPPRTPNVAPQLYTLNVALFPYIPDALKDHYAALLKKIKSDFQTIHPEINLVLRPIDPVNDDFYDFTTLSKWLGQDPASGGYHIVEADTLFLSDLAKNNLISTWKTPPNVPDWQPSALSASQINTTIYGAPHWMCSYFVFSRFSQIVQTKTIIDLVKALKTYPRPSIAGNLDSSWDAPAFYLDSWSQWYGPAGVPSAMTPNLDTTVMTNLKPLSDDCRTTSGNPCLDGTYKDNDDAAIKFAQAIFPSMFGYSERLHVILSSQPVQPDAIQLSMAPLGNNNTPLVFIDSFLLNKQCDTACQNAATAFATYMLSSDTYGWILMSKDLAPQAAVPRYLLPATYSVYQYPDVARDRFYKIIQTQIANLAPFPNAGFPQARKDMTTAILNYLKATPTPIATQPSDSKPEMTQQYPLPKHSFEELSSFMEAKKSEFPVKASFATKKELLINEGDLLFTDLPTGVIATSEKELHEGIPIGYIYYEARQKDNESKLPQGIYEIVAQQKDTILRYTFVTTDNTVADSVAFEKTIDRPHGPSVITCPDVFNNCLLDYQQNIYPLLLARANAECRTYFYFLTCGPCEGGFYPTSDQPIPPTSERCHPNITIRDYLIDKLPPRMDIRASTSQQ